MSIRGLRIEDADRLLEKSVHFPGLEAVFERVRSITDFRRDAGEARILYVCERKQNQDQGLREDTRNGLYVLKCKVQAPPSDSVRTEPLAGPSEFSLAELKVLQTFADTDSPALPHLVAWKKTTQGPDGLVPGGYIVYILMSLMPGLTLLDLKFWSMTEHDREEIRAAFLPVIKHVWRLGFEPYDCALRNVLWEAQTRTLSLVDFEHWNPTNTDPINMNETEEMQRWGLLQRPPPTEFWKEWLYSEGLVARR